MALTKEILAILIPDNEDIVNFTHRTDNEDIAINPIPTGQRF